jgi:hypothetical protein
MKRKKREGPGRRPSCNVLAQKAVTPKRSHYIFMPGFKYYGLSYFLLFFVSACLLPVCLPACLLIKRRRRPRQGRRRPIIVPNLHVFHPYTPPVIILYKILHSYFLPGNQVKVKVKHLNLDSDDAVAYLFKHCLVRDSGRTGYRLNMLACR